MLNTQVFLCRTRALAFAVVFATALILAACGSSDSDTGSKQLSGDIIIDGSSTVFPITEAVAEEFGILTGGKTRITVGISGTGGGFKTCSSHPRDHAVTTDCVFEHDNI